MKITVETRIEAPVEHVWRAWTTPDDIKQWNAASDDWHTTAASVDLRVGDGRDASPNCASAVLVNSRRCWSLANRSFERSTTPIGYMARGTSSCRSLSGESTRVLVGS